MAFCMNCGTQLSEGAKFCADCGTPVGAVEDKSKNKRRSLCEETVFKCSNCGDIMDAHELVCETCEYERRGAKATTSVLSHTTCPKKRTCHISNAFSSSKNCSMPI